MPEGSVEMPVSGIFIDLVETDSLIAVFSMSQGLRQLVRAGSRFAPATDAVKAFGDFIRPHPYREPFYRFEATGTAPIEVDVLDDSLVYEDGDRLRAGTDALMLDRFHCEGP
jgi:hypothetical protein